jgi:glyoxylase-like metal-dependent hydrolase (beta-lactamase superfamily II)
MTLPDFIEPLSEGLFAIDTGFQRPRFDAAYLLVDRGRAAFVDTGTNFAVPRLLAALDALGLGADSVDWVIPTHVHLDHAGGAGLLMSRLPQARLLAHPRGARHLVDPTALVEGALAVYGQQEMDRSYGRIVGIEAGRVTASEDGMRVRVGSRELELADTPGHARHHHCIWDERSQGWFTGDTFGLSYREFDDGGAAWILPTTTPVQFEPEALQASVGRLLARSPQRMYLTHYGAVGDVARLGRDLLALLDRMVATGREAPRGEGRHAWLVERLSALYADDLHRHGCPRPPQEMASLLALDIELNAQGMGIWLDREAARAAGGKA